MNKNQSSGYTLIELMLVVAVIGVLSSLAYAYYGDQVIASRRTDGRAAITATAASLEKCRALYSSYNDATRCNNVFPFPVTSDEGFYSITAAFASSTQFILTATPVGVQAADKECLTMTLSNTGIKSGTGSDPAECW